MLSDLIQKMIERVDLTEQEARAAMEEIMAGRATDAQIAGFLIALRMKGETAQELIGFARGKHQRRSRRQAPRQFDADLAAAAEDKHRTGARVVHGCDYYLR